MGYFVIHCRPLIDQAVCIEEHAMVRGVHHQGFGAILLDRFHDAADLSVHKGMRSKKVRRLLRWKMLPHASRCPDALLRWFVFEVVIEIAISGELKVFVSAA